MTEAEFRDAFRRHKDVLYRYAYRMTGSSSEAEDLVQDCFLTLWKKPEAYDASRGALRSFLLGIARKLILKRWRDERPHEVLEDDSALCWPIDLTSIERWEAVARAVKSLPALQREALILAEYEEMSLEEICQVTEAQLAAVKSRLHRARENLRRMLAPLLAETSTLYGTRK